MKWNRVLIGLGLVAITICMIILLNKGISLRSATLIKPSFIEGSNVSQAVFLRLFPEFQSKDVVVVGFDSYSPQITEVLNKIRENVEDYIKRPVHYFERRNLETGEFLPCQGDCWILIASQDAQEMRGDSFILKKYPQLATKSFFTLTLIEFDGYDGPKAAQCESVQRLDFECLKQLSLREAYRKMRDPQQRYFFLKRYNQNDFFLFIQRDSSAH